MAIQIPLTQGKAMLVDEVDIPLVNRYKWAAHFNGRYWHAVTNAGFPDGKKRTVYFHRLAMSAPARLQVDHKNHDTLDNTRDNLRLCERTGNQGNKPRQANNSTGFKGVHMDKSRARYGAKIRRKGRSCYLGSFSSAEDAARAYDEAAKEYFGEFAWLNFPAG